MGWPDEAGCFGARWRRFGGEKRVALMLWYMSTATGSLELRKAGMRAYTQREMLLKNWRPKCVRVLKRPSLRGLVSRLPDA